MKSIVLLVLGLGFFIFCKGQANLESDSLHKTKYFSFHNNKWINLHHFFYEKAKASEILYPENLWHAAMFYLSGIATEDALNKSGISHELIKKKRMFLKGITKMTFLNLLYQVTIIKKSI